MIALKIIAYVICTVFSVGVVFGVSYVWVVAVADTVIQKYFTHKENFRKNMDTSISEMLKDYPRA